MRGLSLMFEWGKLFSRILMTIGSTSTSINMVRVVNNMGKSLPLSPIGTIFGIIVVLFLLTRVDLQAEAKPEQIHISLGTDETEMVVTWSTVDIEQTKQPVVQYGLNESALSSTTNAVVNKYFVFRQFFTYRALLKDLMPNTVYYYQVGDGQVGPMSQVYSFQTLSYGNLWNPRLAVFGDLGLQNDRTVQYLSKEMQNDGLDAVFHIGDIGYDLYERNGQQGNDFMNLIEPIAARVPYMTCPGNHEMFGNFTHYDARFSMLGDRHQPNHDAPLNNRLNNHFWSVDIGPAHIILFSTEYYYFTIFGWDQIERQYQFLEEDLQRANANRAQRPWIIVMGHRPLYCLRTWDPSCSWFQEERPILRKGIYMRIHMFNKRKYGLEDLFFKYGVDLQFYGHEHFYARMLPMYNFKVKNGSNPNNPYENAMGPTHVTTGCAGNRENIAPFGSIHDWVGYHKEDYGYTRLTFQGAGHVVMEQISDELHGAVIDRVDFVKHQVKPKWMP